MYICLGHHSASTNALLDKKHLMKKRQIDGNLITLTHPLSIETFMVVGMPAWCNNRDKVCTTIREPFEKDSQSCYYLAH